jgi:hypothetical protein
MVNTTKTRQIRVFDEIALELDGVYSIFDLLLKVDHPEELAEDTLSSVGRSGQIGIDKARRYIELAWRMLRRQIQGAGEEAVEFDPGDRLELEEDNPFALTRTVRYRRAILSKLARLTEDELRNVDMDTDEMLMRRSVDDSCVDDSVSGDS